MSLTASEMTPADIAAVTDNNGFGNFGGDGWWLILLFLFAFNGGWGNGFGGNGGGGMMPYFYSQNTDGVVQRGFDTATITNQLSGIQSSISSGFAGAEVAECNRAMNAMQTAYNNQIASMNQNFATAQAIDTRLDNLAMGLQECCCENRANIADLKYTTATEANATRSAIGQSTQAVLDKLCQLELDAKNDKIADLERQLTMANLSASQTAQTAQILADNARQTVALEQYLNPTPIPAYTVANPNCCNPVTSCGCGTF